jgi:hypothetical protein
MPVMIMDAVELDAIARELARLYEVSFGGKQRGRYRISAKHLQKLARRRRLYPEQVRDIGRALVELGFVLLDLETYFVVLSQKTFSSYRRVNEGVIEW